MLEDRNDSMSALSNDDEFNVIHVPLLNEHKHSHSHRSTNNAKGRSTRNYPGTEIDDTGIGIRTMNDDYGVTVAETDTDNGPAYQVLKSKGLLVSKYRKDSFADIFLEMDLEPNSSLKDNFEKKMKWGVYWTPGCGLIVYRFFHKEVLVPPGHVCCFTDEDDNHLFAKPGIHNIQNPFFKQRGKPIPLFGSTNYRNIIEHGDRCCLTVPQGMIGYATDMGRPVLLSPGLHAWKSETVRFERMYRVDDSPVLVIGPYTILTVDAGYMAITTDNGKQVLMEGGNTHLLTHHKWKFEQFINLKIQTEDLKGVNVSTADNILMNIDATIVWKIVDVEKAAILVTETMMMNPSSQLDYASIGTSFTEEHGDIGSLSKLRRDVLKQTLASIARFVSGVNYADYFHYVNSINTSRNNNNNNNNSMNSASSGIVNMNMNMNMNNENGGIQILRKSEEDGSISVSASAAGSQLTIENPMFDIQGLEEVLENAIKVTSEFGVEIMGVNIISAHPVDHTIMNSISSSAVKARAVEIEAEAASISTNITAEAEAKAVLTKARAEAQANILRSDGAKEAKILSAEGDKEVSKMNQV